MVGLGKVTGSRGVLYGELSSRANIVNHILTPAFPSLDYNWDGCTTLCDLGSGVGNFSLPFARLHPDVHVSMLDLPGPMQQARAFWTKEYPMAIDEKRIQFIEADFFEPLPVKDQDIYYVRALNLSPRDHLPNLRR
jgi:hypothetical protein